jgi:hypothetical protein
VTIEMNGLRSDCDFMPVLKGGVQVVVSCLPPDQLAPGYASANIRVVYESTTSSLPHSSTGILTVKVP